MDFLRGIQVFKFIFIKGNKRWLVLFPLAALALLITFVIVKSEPKQNNYATTVPRVSAIQAQVQPLSLHVIGYGKTHAKQTWQAVSEVSGAIIYRNPDLALGAMLAKNTTLFKIDPLNYQLKLAQAKSDLNSARSQVERVDFNNKKLELALKIERNRLALVEQELKRKQGLLKQGSISRSVVDQEQSNVLLQQQKVLDIETNLHLIPTDLAVAKAQLEVSEIKVQEAELLLTKTEISMPFDGRVTEVHADQAQVIGNGAMLLQADQLGLMEVNAQFTFNDVRSLITQVWPQSQLSFNGFPQATDLGLIAHIQLTTGDQTIKWPARVTHFNDSKGQIGNFVQIVAEVENSWQAFNPIIKPPLINDILVQVIVATPAKAVLSIPLRSIRNNSVYVVEQNQLKIKPVKVLFETEEFAALDSSITGTVVEGDWVITTDLLPAIEGMAVLKMEQQP